MTGFEVENLTKRFVDHRCIALAAKRVSELERV
jgi:hypothetical protein